MTPARPPPCLCRFINTVVAAAQVEERGVGINITEFKYRFNAGESAQILWGAGIQDANQLASLIKELNSASMPTVDVSKMESAQLHLRHLVGGRARCAVAGTLLGEQLFQVRVFVSLKHAGTRQAQHLLQVRF